MHAAEGEAELVEAFGGFGGWWTWGLTRCGVCAIQLKIDEATGFMRCVGSISPDIEVLYSDVAAHATETANSSRQQAGIFPNSPPKPAWSPVNK